MHARGGREAIPFHRACTRTPWNNEEAWTDGPTAMVLTFCANVLIEWMEGREGGREGGRKERRTYRHREAGGEQATKDDGK